MVVRGRFVSQDALRLRERARPRSICDPGAIVLHRKFAVPIKSCATQPAATLAATETARTFERREFGASDPYFFTPIVYGCLYADDAVFKLGENGAGADGHGQTLHEFQLAGTYAAYGNQVCRIDFCSFDVAVIDLRDGRKLRRAPSLGESGSGGPVSDLVLTETGSVAWIAYQVKTEVWIADATGVRMLDEGRAIDRKSLSLNGSSITWLNGGDRRSAAIF